MDAYKKKIEPILSRLGELVYLTEFDSSFTLFRKTDYFLMLHFRCNKHIWLRISLALNFVSRTISGRECICISYGNKLSVCKHLIYGLRMKFTEIIIERLVNAFLVSNDFEFYCFKYPTSFLNFKNDIFNALYYDDQYYNRLKKDMLNGFKHYIFLSKVRGIERFKYFNQIFYFGIDGTNYQEIRESILMDENIETKDFFDYMKCYYVSVKGDAYHFKKVVKEAKSIYDSIYFEKSICCEDELINDIGSIQFPEEEIMNIMLVDLSEYPFMKKREKMIESFLDAYKLIPL